MATYNILNGSKLEYSDDNSTWTQIIGLKTMPDFGSTPNKVDTTTLDNTTYETNINGLIPALDLTYEFNLEDPSATANLNLAIALDDGDTYYWRVTFGSGIIITYQSKVKIGIKGGSSEDLESFEMYHAPESGITITMPSNS